MINGLVLADWMLRACMVAAGIGAVVALAWFVAVALDAKRDE